MTDPSDALESFRAAFARGVLALRPCELASDIFLHVDAPAGVPRFTYFRIENGEMTAHAMLATVDPYDGAPCFHLGYAVAAPYRGHGRAEALVRAAIDELQAGFGRAGVGRYFIEAVVGLDNLASQRVAERTVSRSPQSITDQASGLPALHYLREIKR